MNWGHEVTLGQLMVEYPCLRVYRELINVATTKCLGTEELAPGYAEANKERVVGAWGARELLLTSPLELQRGHRMVVVKASERKPIKCKEHIYAHL